MSRQQQLKQLNVEQREQQLDAREKAVIKKEALLNDSQLVTRLDILEKQIAIREDVRDGIDKQIKEQIDILKTFENMTAEAQLEIKEAELSTKEDVKRLNKKMTDAQAQLKVATDTLADIREQIHEQQSYLKEQQLITDDTINNWNDQLKEFKEASSEAQRDKDQLIQDVLRYQEDKEALVKDAKNTQIKADELDRIYQEKVIQYRIELAALTTQVQDAEQKLLIIDQQIKARFESVNTAEKSLVIQERAYRTKELELLDREKNFNMKISLSTHGLQ